MNHFIRIIIAFMLVISALYADKTAVMFWNTENLFHPDNDPVKNDEEFTPDGAKHYTMKSYRYKLEQLARVINKVHPEIIGFAETENIQVLRDLAARLFQYEQWTPLLLEGTDQRGIDVSLMFRRDRFVLARVTAHPVKYQSGGRTRDILQADLIPLTDRGDTLTLFVVHFPSRYGGKAASSPRREQVAAHLSHIVASLSKAHPNRDMLVMGDFNDTKRDPSLMYLQDRGLIPLITESDGTYYYGEKWFDFDHLFGNEALLDAGHFSVIKESGRTVSYPFMLEESRNGKDHYPRRFYRGDRFAGGYSDHLPVYIELNY